MANKFIYLLRDAALLAVMIAVLTMVWTSIGGVAPFFSKLAGLGVFGITVGLWLSLVIGMPLVAWIKMRFKWKD